MSQSSENEDLELGEEQSSADEELASGGEEDVENEAEEETDEGEESGAEEPDINASATESDEDDNDEIDDDEDIAPTKKNLTVPAKKIAKITDAIMERHEKRKGKQLYIRFPEKLPESIEDFQKKVKSLSELIVESHKPRQKHARFCLVDFANTEDRDKALKELSKKDPKIVVSLPKTDNDDFIKTLVEKKIKQSEKKRAKNLLRKQSKKNVAEKTFTSILMVLNLPNSASIPQLKELFPNAVDIQTKGATGKYADKMIATVTMPSTEDAKVNSKRRLVFGGNKLLIRLNKNKKQLRKNKASKNATSAQAPKKGPIAPAKPEGKNLESPKKSAQSPKKRSISENGSTSVPEKKAKGKKPFKGNTAPNGKPGGKPNKQNKQKNKPPKKGKAVPAAAE